MTTQEIIETPEEVLAAEPPHIEIPEGGEDHRTILEVWLKVLEPIETEKDRPVTPQYAMSMVSQYPGIKFKDMLDFRDEYFARLEALRYILQVEIESDPVCLDQRTVEDDRTHNADHYKNVMMQWQLQFLQWEIDWDCQDPDAEVALGTISETHKMFFGDKGLLPFLDSINFNEMYTEADAEQLAGALMDLREASSE